MHDFKSLGFQEREVKMEKLRQRFFSKNVFYEKRDRDSSDFKIIVQGITFHVHKFNLAYNSPVFKKWFKDNELEISPKEQFSITNFTVTKVDEYLQFFYPELRAILKGMQNF